MAPSGRNPPTLSHRRLLLTEESARVLAAYHRLKQQWETNRANEGEILKLIDVADEARMKWKAAEIRRTAAEEQSGRDRQSTLTNLGRADAENERETAAVRSLLEMPAKTSESSGWPKARNPSVETWWPKESPPRQ
ncbi:hypothetical protein M3Y99_00429700 [Aphelenchoides fujianensis]|nr:hypothetical protein M3Y99_00429700 [Aphelenchoides fujianensis]